MSELNCSTIPCLGSMEKGEFILLAIEVVGYFDRSAGIQRSLQMGTFQRVLRRVFTKKIINIFNIFVINITIIDIMIIVIVTIVMIEWSVSPDHYSASSSCFAAPASHCDDHEPTAATLCC